MSAVISGRVLATDVESAIRTTFVRPWVQALKSGDAAQLKKFMHRKFRRA
jgi:hypothetical protein